MKNNLGVIMFVSMPVVFTFYVFICQYFEVSTNYSVPIILLYGLFIILRIMKEGKDNDI